MVGRDWDSVIQTLPNRRLSPRSYEMKVFLAFGLGLTAVGIFMLNPELTPAKFGVMLGLVVATTVLLAWPDRKLTGSKFQSNGRRIGRGMTPAEYNKYKAEREV